MDDQIFALKTNKKFGRPLHHPTYRRDFCDLTGTGIRNGTFEFLKGYSPEIGSNTPLPGRDGRAFRGPICAGEMHLWGKSFLCDALRSSAVTGIGLASVCAGSEAS